MRIPLSKGRRIKQWVAIGAVGLALGLSSCGDSGRSPESSARILKRMSEVSPPAVIQALASLGTAKPQVSILSPRSDDVIDSDNVDVRLQVKGFDLYQDETLGLGPHLNIFIDSEFYGSIYDVSTPLELKGLTPGTHTLRAIATSAWNESIKTAEAYAQTTFHIYTKTPLVEPPEGLPLLTFNQPSDEYGAEPILLDYYVNPVPPPSTEDEELALTPQGWKVRATINGEPFIFDQWEAIYLKGFKSGKNWVQLELLDANTQPIASLFNNTARVIEYHPGGDTPMAQLMRDELSIEAVGVIVDPNYMPPAPEPAPEMLKDDEGLGSIPAADNIPAADDSDAQKQAIESSADRTAPSSVSSSEPIETTQPSPLDEVNVSPESTPVIPSKSESPETQPSAMEPFDSQSGRPQSTSTAPPQATIDKIIDNSAIDSSASADIKQTKKATSSNEVDLSDRRLDGIREAESASAPSSESFDEQVDDFEPIDVRPSERFPEEGLSEQTSQAEITPDTIDDLESIEDSTNGSTGLE